MTRLFHYEAQQPLVPHNNYVVFDIETAARPGHEAFVEMPEAPGNLKDPVKVRAAIEKKMQDQFARVPLDPNLCRIVALGVYDPQDDGFKEFICTNDDEERHALSYLWSKARPSGFKRRPLIGFCCKTFDVPVCLRRTQLLGMPAPDIKLNRHDRDYVIDLHQLLTFDIYNENGVMRRRLKNFCTLFGVPEFDDCDGADIAALVAVGNMDEVRKHVRADVERTFMLAQKMGVI